MAASSPSKDSFLQTLVFLTQARLSCAQLCQQSTFGSASTQALDVLGDVLRQQNCGRTECNLQDVFSSIQVLGLTSTSLKDHIAQQRTSGFSFLYGGFYADQVPMRRRILRPRRTDPREADDQIPSYFPPDPPAHTFMFTPVEVSRPREIPNEKSAYCKEKRALEDRLATLLAQEPPQIDSSPAETFQNPFLTPFTPDTRKFLEEI